MRIATAVLVTALTVTAARAEQASDRYAPEAGSVTGIVAPQQATARRHMVVAAHPLAARAGLEVLDAGGSAVDALVATQMVLGLVEPQSSGLGGGGFLLHYAAANGGVTSLDGRETAPAAATPDMFLGTDGQPLPFFTAVVGGRSVGTPATLRLMVEAHRRFGRLAFTDLLKPAIRLAENGFPVSPRLADLIAAEGERLKHDPVTAAYFFDAAGAPLRAGATLRNPAYADTLRRISDGGEDVFYRGEIAADIVAKVMADPVNPGRLSASDLENYTVIEREPVCNTVFAVEVCGMGLPSSGGIATLQILGLVEPWGIEHMSPQAPETWRLIGDASRLAFADRERWLADPAFVRAPVAGLLATGYLSLRAKLLDGPNAMPEVTPGQPAFDDGALWPMPPAGVTPELPSTTQVVIRDDAGDMLSYTGTIENGFGSRLMVRGFLLNNELTDFSFAPTGKDGAPVANRVEGGKRPRSSMAPTLVLRDGVPVLAIGSPGGSRIIGFVAQALIAHLAWKKPVAEIVAMPHLLNRFGPFEVEAGTAATALVPGLQALGYRVEVQELNSGLAAIAVTPAGLEGAADPRREGAVLGR
ncbi:gamma-glutamyltransferase [Zavarzinia aquatilis]|uniref:Glutathione hydrolase proenzyme n=1 Tax=Zavarzinia aquatilis TaxID=2211142 RepID=A0A317EEV9_9PROT|nr:gamma-glutamyltransferase [Zavarzinia aquatilis]PWR25152.1 gamma-glutamyltransferase [Zavarzinia aquatilis]